jgi:hypothetical protein
LFLRHNRFEYTLLVHVVSSEVAGVNTNEWVGVFDLHFLNFLNVIDWVQTGVFGQAHWNGFKGISETSNCILFNTVDLIGLGGDSDRASELSGTSSTNDIIVFDHISNDANGIE